MSVTAEPSALQTVECGSIPDVPIYRLSVEQYHAMGRAGILTEDDRVELLEGWLVQKMTKYRPHVIATGLVRRAMEPLLAMGWYISVQDPITTTESEPEPDLAVVRGEERDYPDRHPGPADVSMVVEIADSSLEQDRGAKKRLYARAGIAVYWIVNLVEHQIEVHTEPTGPAEEPDYRQRRDYGLADTIPVVLDRDELFSLAVRELLP